MEPTACEPVVVTGGDESVECHFTSDGIVIYSGGPERTRQYSMPWSWLLDVLKSINGA